ncbi:TasA family protein [Halosimplex sp. TS25]|uniref:TasA family protein n=1 Tax=Halosimplex rarum TaxID=3396619 RepID=UPI0039EB2012
MSDDESKIELNRRRVLGGIVTVGAAAAAAGAGTFAAFSDTESSNDNSVSAGTLDLTVNSGSDPVTVLSVTDAVPNGSGSGDAITLANAGSVDGTLDISVAAIDSSENGTPDPEGSAPDEGQGVELEDALTITVTLGGNDEFTDTIGDLSADQTIVSGQTLNAGGSTDFNLSYSISDAGNEIQTDSVSLDFDFTLNQA